MSLQVEIVERSSVIVVTVTGPTDIAALEPLNGALQVAAIEGSRDPHVVSLEMASATNPAAPAKAKAPKGSGRAGPGGGPSREEAGESGHRQGGQGEG